MDPTLYDGAAERQLLLNTARLDRLRRE